MATDKFYVGGFGYKIQIDMRRSMTGATNLSFLVLKGDGKSTATFTPVTINSTNSNILEYTIEDGDFDTDKPGVWRFQPVFTLAGSTAPHDIVEQRIEKKIVVE